MMTLKCGCVLTENAIHFQKKLYDENGQLRDFDKVEEITTLSYILKYTKIFAEYIYN